MSAQKKAPRLLDTSALARGEEGGRIGGAEENTHIGRMWQCTKGVHLLWVLRSRSENTHVRRQSRLTSSCTLPRHFSPSLPSLSSTSQLDATTHAIRERGCCQRDATERLQPGPRRSRRPGSAAYARRPPARRRERWVTPQKSEKKQRGEQKREGLRKVCRVEAKSERGARQKAERPENHAGARRSVKTRGHHSDIPVPHFSSS